MRGRQDAERPASPGKLAGRIIAPMDGMRVEEPAGEGTGPFFLQAASASSSAGSATGLVAIDADGAAASAGNSRREASTMTPRPK